MATIEERLALLEHEQVRLKSDNAELKKTVELQTIAIGALVNFDAIDQRFDSMQEDFNKKFDRILKLLEKES